VKRESTKDISKSPVVLKLLPDDRFFQMMEDIHRVIARRAYELFSARAFTHGRDLDDWLQAESEILESVPVELSETEDSITVVAKLPGCRAKDVEIQVNARHFFVSGRQDEKTDKKKGKTRHSELPSRCVSCVVELPAPIDPAKVSGTLTNGKLRIELPKRKKGEKLSLAAKAAA
jgi:HSP20 family protein